MSNTPMSLRLSPTARTLLKRIAEKQHLTQTGVLELIIRQEARRLNIEDAPEASAKQN